MPICRACQTLDATDVHGRDKLKIPVIWATRVNPVAKEVWLKAVTKDIFLNARECITRGWFLRHGLRPTPSEADQFRFAEGNQVGDCARRLYPIGIMAPQGRPSEVAEATRMLLDNPNTAVVFEATILVDGYVAKPDVLVRTDQGWELVEVKSNTDGTGKIDLLFEDLAYTVMVARRAGVEVTLPSLMLVSRDFRRGMPDEALFVRRDLTAAVEEKITRFLPEWDHIARATASDEPPCGKLILACKGCPFFGTQCIGRGSEHPVVSLPGLREKKLLALVDAHVREIRDIPADFKLSASQSRVASCVRTNSTYVSPDLRAELDCVVWPAYYLDFETVQTVVPLYDGVAPYEQVLTQYSIHRCAEPGAATEHFQYLADPCRDCRHELAESLLRALDLEGSIIVYSNFERRCIQMLAKLFPDLSERLLALRARLYDLSGVIRDCYYEPRFGGSFSLKDVLPVLVPELSYDGLGIADGGTAIARFAKMARGQCSPEEALAVRQHLLEYCRQDTLAMVKLHEKLLAVAVDQRGDREILA